ncbi:MAG: ATP-grasp domain-containing protein [Bacteroidota bacterium]
MKIIITDIFLRKSFDIVNILKKHYGIETLIFTHSSIGLITHFKVRLIYGSQNLWKLRKGKNFIKDLHEITKYYNCEELVYMPIEEQTTVEFYNYLEKKPEVCNLKFLLPDKFNFNLSRNKMKLNLFCEQNGIPCPQFINKERYKKSDFELPIIIKPKQGSGAKGIIYIDNISELRNISIDFNRNFVQERLPNSKDVQAGFFLCKEGDVISYYGHKRIRTFPESGGVSIFSESEYSVEIKKVGKDLIKKLNWSGLIMIEYIFDERDQKFKVIEINPRLWGSVLLSEYCNASFLMKYVELSLGKNISSNVLEKKCFIRWIFPYDILFWIKNISNPFIFFKLNKDTCYINFTYSNFLRSLCFIIITYFKFSKFKKIFKNA